MISKQRIISIQGDYIAVGAPEDDDHGYSTGATYFYQNTGSSWTLLEKIVPDAVEEWNYLGSCVLVHNGYVYMGARRHDDPVEKGAKLKLENGDIHIEPFNPEM